MPSDSLPPMTERRRPPRLAAMELEYWFRTSSAGVVLVLVEGVLDSRKRGLSDCRRSQMGLTAPVLLVCQRRITWSR